MTLVQDTVWMFRHRRVVVLATIVVALLGAGVLWYFVPLQFTTTTTQNVAALAPDAPQFAYEGNLPSQQRVKSYVHLVATASKLRSTASQPVLPVPHPHQVVDRSEG